MKYLLLTALLMIPNYSKANSKTYLGISLLNDGHAVSVTQREGMYYYGYTHQSNQFQQERYTSDLGYFGYKLKKQKKYSVFLGGLFGLEQHDLKTEYFNRSYLISKPRVSIWKRYNKILAVGADLDIGKIFYTLEQQDNDAPFFGYQPVPQVSFGLNFNLD